MGFCGLINGFVTFYCFKCLEEGELIFCVNFEFFLILFSSINGEILKKNFVVLLCYGVLYSSFIIVMNEDKYGRILKVKSVVR